MPCSWREEDGLRYLYADYRDLTLEERLKTLEESVEIVKACEPGVRLLVHVDSKGKPSSEFLNAVKLAVRGPMAEKQVRSAFIGIDGLGRAVLRSLQLISGGFPTQPFATKEKALKYLAGGPR